MAPLAPAGGELTQVGVKRFRGLSSRDMVGACAQ